MARRSDREIVLTRHFDAPPHVVFDALTNAELIKHWFGPAGWSVLDVKLELRTGGTCDLTMRDPDGNEMRMHAVYREIVHPERIVRTELFDGWPAVESTVDLTERNGGTVLTAAILYPSAEVCEADISGGLERDAPGAYKKLADSLAGS